MLETAVKAAQAAGGLLKSNYTLQQEISYKDALNAVTKTDVAAEKIILEIIQDAFPDHAIFSEEAGLITKPSEYLWVIDPLDGTNNFTHHLDNFAVSIALQHQQQLVLGVIYNPLTDELFTAEVGHGAFLNNDKITVSTTTQLDRVLTTYTRTSNPLQITRAAATFNAVTAVSPMARMLGSTALCLCYLACGRCDAFICNGCNFYDFAAGVVIAREAGATITTFTHEPLVYDPEHPSDILASNTVLHLTFLKLLESL